MTPPVAAIIGPLERRIAAMLRAGVDFLVEGAVLRRKIVDALGKADVQGGPSVGRSRMPAASQARHWSYCPIRPAGRSGRAGRAEVDFSLSRPYWAGIPRLQGAYRCLYESAPNGVELDEKKLADMLRRTAKREKSESGAKHKKE